MTGSIPDIVRRVTRAATNSGLTVEHVSANCQATGDDHGGGGLRRCGWSWSMT